MPNTTATQFALASVTKLFTQVAIMQLAQAGKLSLDEPVRAAWPDYPNPSVASQVPIRELLDHRSGLADFTGDLHGSPSAFSTPASILPLFVNKPLLFEPGTKRTYSNAGYIVLALIIERTTGQTYFDYVADHIFKPAGMNDTVYLAPPSLDRSVALAYTTCGEAPGAPPRVAARPPRGISAAGGAYSNAEDLWRFSQALLNDRLLNRDFTERLLDDGYGMLVGTLDGVRFAGHGAGEAGANTYFELYPDLHDTVVILANEDPPAAAPLFERIQRDVTGIDPGQIDRSSRQVGPGATAPSADESHNDHRAPDLSGEWLVELRINDRVGAVPVCEIHQMGPTLSGSCKGPHSSGPLTGTVDAQRVHLTWLTHPATANGASGLWLFTGTLEPDGVIRGIGTTPSGQPGGFTARKK